jgi:hypothetical protein
MSQIMTNLTYMEKFRRFCCDKRRRKPFTVQDVADYWGDEARHYSHLFSRYRKDFRLGWDATWRKFTYYPKGAKR